MTSRRTSGPCALTIWTPARPGVRLALVLRCATLAPLLARGARLTELLKQPQFSPMPVEEQVVSIYAGTKGYLDALPVNKVGQFESRMLNELKLRHPEVLASIRDTREMKPDTEKALVGFLDGFSKQFA